MGINIPVSPNIILQLHRDMYRYIPASGGVWKNQDNVIEEILPDGRRYIRFKPVPAMETPMAVDELNYLYNRELREESIEPLILIGAFILDFLCIHPFNDGNGRMARLLTLLLLDKAGFEVGRFISLEKIIEESKESYYDSLYKSSIGWHDGNHNINYWLEYWLGSVLAAYKAFESRVGVIEKTRGNKSDRIQQAIMGVLGEFSKEDIRNACPDASPSSINRVFAQLKEDGAIEPLGKGRNARWRRLR